MRRKDLGFKLIDPDSGHFVPRLRSVRLQKIKSSYTRETSERPPSASRAVLTNERREIADLC